MLFLGITLYNTLLIQNLLIMKKSIILAIIILVVTLGWLGSGQLNKKNITNKEEIKFKENKNSELTNENLITNENNKIKVETKKFISKLVDQSIILQGQTIYNKKVDVKSETVGNVISIKFIRGQEVKKNQALIKISKENRLELLNSAKKLIQLYELEFSSAKKLVDKGLSSKSKLGLASYNLANAKSQLKNIQLDIENTKVLSPFDGIITEKNIEITDYVIPGTVLFTIVNLNPIKIRGYLSEFDIDKIKINTKAIIKNVNGIKKIGSITFISPSAETSTRTFEIVIEADNSDLLFKSGITASIIIEG